MLRGSLIFDDLGGERVLVVAVGSEELQHAGTHQPQQQVGRDVGGVEGEQVLAQHVGVDVEVVGQLSQRHAVGVRQQVLEDPGEPRDPLDVLRRRHQRSPPAAASSASSSSRNSSGPTSVTRDPSS